MNEDPIKKIRDIGNHLIAKSYSLKELGKIIPDQSRKLAAYGEYYMYVAAEYDRISSTGTDFRASTELNLHELEQTLHWEPTSTHDIITTTVAASGSSTSITAPMLPYIDNEPDLNLLKSPPQSFSLLKATDDTFNKLNELKNGLGETWKSAWNSLSIGELDSIKRAAINARTVIDELSWRAPYDHLSKLDWCQFDEKAKPTRASRFAWILHGDKLPEELNNDPSNDLSWKFLGKNYNALQKYIHLSSLKSSDFIHIEIIIKAIQESLENYLNFGFERMQLCASNFA